MPERYLDADWRVLLEEIGLSMPAEVNNEEVNGKKFYLDGEPKEDFFFFLNKKGKITRCRI